MSVHEAEARRERIVTALRRQLRELPYQRRSRTRLRVFAALAAAAGVLGAGLLVWQIGTPEAVSSVRGEPGLELRELSGVVLLEEPSGTRRLGPGAELSLPLAGRLRVEQGGRAELKTERGLTLSLAESSVVSLAELGRSAQERLQLVAGQVTCQVPRLGQGESFDVVTPSARVVVHGTVFSVRVNEAAADGNSTCVEVSEGAVIVHHAAGQVALNSGESWGCGRKLTRAEHSADRTEAWRPGRTPPAREAAELKKPAGTLEPEVRLLQTALVHERNGDEVAAEKSLALLLRKYPHSPLSTEARAALARIRAKR